jgi:hypothetical protein
VHRQLLEETLTPSYDHVRDWVRRLPGPAAVAYEAGPTGFGLYRALTAAGIRCEVVAPSKLMRPAGNRVKTDKRDAIHLARLLHLDEFTPVSVPTVGAEAARDLMRARYRASKMLLRHGIIYSGGAKWTGLHLDWIRRQRLPQAPSQLALEEYYDTLLVTTARRDRLDAAIEAMAADSEFTAIVRRLGCLRGVAALTGFALAVEIGDWHRFTAKTIGSFVAAGAQRGIFRCHQVTGIDHQDRQQARPPAPHRGRLASPQALPTRNRDQTPMGPGPSRCPRPRRCGQPPAAPTVAGLRCPAEEAGHRQHRDRPRARLLVLVLGHHGGLTPSSCPPSGQRHEDQGQAWSDPRARYEQRPHTNGRHARS